MTWSDLLGPAFLADGYVGHLSYLLLVISMMMRRMLLLRLFVIASALVGIAYDLFWLDNPVGVVWETLLLIVTLFQLLVLWTRDRTARFSDEEKQLVDDWLRKGSVGQHRALLDLGRWENLTSGTALTREGQSPDFLCYLASGAARVETSGQIVAELDPGHFLGEMSLLGDDCAAADTILTTDSRVWRVERDKIERLRDSGSALWQVLEAAISLDMRAKLINANRRSAAVTTPA